ncbi:MAG: ACT domain-containing protein [Verrucomicrobiales bacterium]|nr:ACT domain-containing protein [Verrucomicrobiales bacterium]
MNLIVEAETVWAAGLEDRPGALAGKLAELSEAGADLDFIIARRAADRPGTGVVFVTPLRGDREVEAAGELGFSATNRLHSVRVEGRNEPGVAARITQRIAQAGLNLRGFSGAIIGTQFVLHLAFDSDEDSRRAVTLLQTPA